MKAGPQENPNDVCTTGTDNWIYGNIIIDRDIYGPGDYGDYGVSLGGGRLMFGVGRGNDGGGICGEKIVTDGEWHHIAVTRSEAGQLRIWVDGELDAQGPGPSGDISHRDDRSTFYVNDPYFVIGAEKHDAGPQYPSYSGLIDELRVSNRIRYTVPFTRPTQPFTTDSHTMALYHMDEESGDELVDSSGAVGGPSRGEVRYGGDPAGPVWVRDTPFGNNQSTPTPTLSTSPNSPTPTRTPSRTPTISTAPSSTPTATGTPGNTTPTATPTDPPLPGTITATPVLSESLYLPMVRRR